LEVIALAIASPCLLQPILGGSRAMPAGAQRLAL
jgi:hypothetical protein